MIIEQTGLNEIWGFLSPERRQRHLDDERDYLRQKLRSPGEFTDSTKWARELPLSGRAFSAYVRPYSLFDIKPYPLTSAGISEKALLRAVAEGRAQMSSCQRYVYAEIKIPAAKPLSLAKGIQHMAIGHCFFDTPPVVPALYELRGSEARTWMTMSPNEFITQRSGIKAAKGDVVVGGLGLGYLLRQVAAKKSVRSVTVVEIAPSLADWYGRRLCAELEKAHRKPVRLVVGDVFDVMLSGDYHAETHWSLDVWSNYPTTYLHGKAEQAVAAVKNFWGWGVPKSCVEEAKYKASRTSPTR